MFGSSPTPSRSGTWPRYNGTSPPFSLLNHDLFTQPQQPIPHHPNPTHNQTPTSHTRSQSFSHPNLSPSLSSSPAAFDLLKTPIVHGNYHTRSPLMHMSPYPTTPSPPPSFGISGGMIVSEENMLHAQSMSCATATSDVFLSNLIDKPSRPALRPALSHNGSYTLPPPAIYPRRSMTVNEAANIAIPVSADRTRPSTGTITHHHQPPSQHAFSAHTNTPFATLTGNTNVSSIPTPLPLAPSYIPINTSSSDTTHSQPIPIPQPPVYNDELSFHTTSYQSYDSSGSYPPTGHSPWLPPVQLQHPQFGRPQPYYAVYGMAAMKDVEPILSPGEIPAPRPSISYAALIGEALLNAPPPHQLYVSEISDSVKRKYAYYRQNPSKIYNGVRHQTSMCKAFVKLPRPYGDQSGGARKWAIRAGCETWFTGGGYHPPGTASPLSASKSPNTTHPRPTKAKSTAKAKQLAIGTGGGADMVSPNMRKPVVMDNGPWSGGPSSGPAFDGTGKPFIPHPHSQYQHQHQHLMQYQYPPQYHSYPSQSQHQHQHRQQYLPQGYHYMPIHNAPQFTQQHQQYVPAWYNGHSFQAGSPEEFESGLRMEGMGAGVENSSSERDSPYEHEEKVGVSPRSGHGSVSSEGH